MTLTSVLLPAPLSPISPSTSPARSSQAHVAQRGDRAEALGHALDLEHDRPLVARSSGGVAPPAATRSRPAAARRRPLPRRPVPRPRPGSARGAGRSASAPAASAEHDADREVGVVRADVQQDQAVVQHADEEHAEEHAPERAAAAGEGHAAEQDRRQHLQLEADADRRARRRRARRSGSARRPPPRRPRRRRRRRGCAPAETPSARADGAVGADGRQVPARAASRTRCRRRRGRRR